MASVDEDLVELRFAGDLVHRPHLDAGLPHRQHEEADALVFGHVPVGAGDQHAVVGGGGERRPDLLAVDHPVVALAVGAGAQAGQVRSRAGLAVEQAPLALAADRRRDQRRFCSSVPTSCRVLANRFARSWPVPGAPTAANSAATMRAWASERPRPYHSGSQLGTAQRASTTSLCPARRDRRRESSWPPANRGPRRAVRRRSCVAASSLRSAADSVRGATTGRPTAGRRCGPGADTGAPDAPR